MGGFNKDMLTDQELKEKLIKLDKREKQDKIMGFLVIIMGVISLLLFKFPYGIALAGVLVLLHALNVSNTKIQKKMYQKQNKEF